MENLRGWAIPVFILVAGAGVWIFTRSPGYGLVALLAGLLLWEVGRRSRYGHHLRFLPSDRSRARRGPVRTAPNGGAQGTGRRAPWHRPPGAPPPVRTLPPRQPRRTPPPSKPRRP